MRTVGFLHTAQVHVATFDQLVDELAPGAAAVNSVDESLLDMARISGVEDRAVASSVERALVDLVSRGADVIVCTCSTIGGVAEDVGRRRGLDVVRVDRPMAELAVAAGERVAIVAALDSTVAPTTALLRETATGQGRSIEVETVVVDAAWERFEAGDIDGYLAAIAGVLPVVAQRCDVIVLAQASMAGAAGLVEVAVPVLASPRIAIEALVAG